MSKLATVATLTKKVDPELVAYMEKALAAVRAGDTTGVVLLEYHSDGLRYTTCGVHDRYQCTGFLYHALHKLQTD